MCMDGSALLDMRGTNDSLFFRCIVTIVGSIGRGSACLTLFETRPGAGQGHYKHISFECARGYSLDRESEGMESMLFK